MQEVVVSLFRNHFGSLPERVEILPASGSARKYYRIYAGKTSYIGAWHSDLVENRLFIAFSRHFRSKGLHVPEVYVVSSDELAYIQEDLGDTMLLDVVQREKTEDGLNPSVMQLYRKSLAELVRFQVLGHEGMDYSHCLPRPVFDRRCMEWDLNYFKYCFLRLAGACFSEDALENDFERLITALCRVPADFFMFRDFQSRNIMVRRGEVWFIDYQGGRRGALCYDVASLLYDPIVGISDVQRQALLNFYLDELRSFRPDQSGVVEENFGHFVLIRLLQAMGAFGLRGLYERKQHFIDSIRPGLQIIARLLTQEGFSRAYPEIRRTVSLLLECQD